MNAEDYKNLKRFNPEEHHYKHLTYFNDDDIFETYNLRNQLKYLKVKASLNNLLFDLTECTPDGESVRCPFSRNSITISEILERINENDWRLFKKANNR
jgi:hypothetical protein